MRDEAYSGSPGTQPCPFRIKGGSCTKKGGVCSFRLYRNDDGLAVPTLDDEDGLRILCPRRFEEDMTIFQWVGETILGTPTPEIVTEIGFLKAENGNAHVGRIDMVLANRKSQAALLDWCALEIQAVYFSGKSMADEFRKYRSVSKETGHHFRARHADRTTEVAGLSD